jgi:hypothetical protein
VGTGVSVCGCWRYSMTTPRGDVTLVFVRVWEACQRGFAITALLATDNVSSVRYSALLLK